MHERFRRGLTAPTVACDTRPPAPPGVPDAAAAIDPAPWSPSLRVSTRRALDLEPPAARR